MDEFDRTIHSILRDMTPRQIGLMLHPQARPVDLEKVPPGVLEDRRQRFTEEELRAGQFLEVLPGRYTFIMDHAAYDKRSAS